MTNPLNAKHRLEIYKDDRGEFRWRRKAGNHKIISVSGEGYTRKVDVLHGMEIANVDHDQCRIIDSTLEFYKDPE